MAKSASDDEGAVDGIKGPEERQRKFQGFILRKHLLVILYHIIKTQLEKERKELLARSKRRHSAPKELQMEPLEEMEEGRTVPDGKEKGKETDSSKDGASNGGEDNGSTQGEKEKENSNVDNGDVEKNDASNKNETPMASEGEPIKPATEQPSHSGDNVGENLGVPKIMESTIEYGDFYRADYPPFTFSILTPRQRDMYIDLRPCILFCHVVLNSFPQSVTLTMKDINLSAFTVTSTWSLNETYQLFRTMGMRHLTVGKNFRSPALAKNLISRAVDDGSQVVGMVTRNDLL